MAGLAGDARVHVPHVREVHVLGHLVNTNPRDRLAHAALVEVRQLLDLGALVRGMLAGNRWTLRADDEVTAHARADRGKTRIRGFVRRVVAVQTVQAEPLHVNRVREIDRLLWLTAL